MSRKLPGGTFGGGVSGLVMLNPDPLMARLVMGIAALPELTARKRTSTELPAATCLRLKEAPTGVTVVPLTLYRVSCGVCPVPDKGKLWTRLAVLTVSTPEYTTAVVGA